MKRWMIGLSGLGLLVAAEALAQDRGPDRTFEHGRGAWRALMSSDDRAAFTDARIAALHAGLKLTPDQEKLWPPVEDAIRGWAKQRDDARKAMHDRVSAGGGEGLRDVPGMLRAMADRQAASADALRKLSDATGPLYAALDDAQKRRLVVLGRGLQPGLGWRHGGPETPMRRG